MGIRKQSGFTIIEVMLFLGVTGMLAVGILVGSGVAIGQQRYRDSVNSLKSFLQEQYNQTTNVTNARDSSWTCAPSAAITEGPGGQVRGTTDCVLLGRFVTINELGVMMTVSNVVGSRNAGATPANSDIEELKTNYQLGLSPIDQEQVEVNWGAQIVRPNTTTPMPFSMLIVRSPLNGSVMTFTSEGITTNLKDLIEATNLSQTRDLCVNADAGSFVGRRMEVRINPFAANAGAIQIPPESESVCG
jgi:type II secretory pathway pseudopilin PulG